MLNSNEIRLLLSELKLEGAFIQKVTEHDWHSFTLSLFSKSEKAFLLYFELGTASQHFCRTDVMRKKSVKAQRFTQYLRANIVGSRIMEVTQIPAERVFTFTLSHNGETRKLHFRYFSGAGANIIVTDEDNMILELLMRRPQRGEEKGLVYTPEEPRVWDEERFPIRPWEGESFNAYIDRYYRDEDRGQRTSDALSTLALQRDRELAGLRSLIRDLETRVEKSKDYESFKESADLLSSYSYLVKRGASTVELVDWQGEAVTIALDAALDASGNINAYYQKYKRQERIYRNAVEELEEAKGKLQDRIAYYSNLLDGDGRNLGELEKAVKKQAAPTRHTASPYGLHFTSFGFEIIVGRNAKENDEILRHIARSNDTWLHVRDFSGGYVIIKGRKDKSIPLEVLLDAGNLAIHYSKAKGQKVADLYYTQVKYLRRIKDGKKGLVTPTQEKNLSIRVDDSRLKRLLLQDNEEDKS